MLSLLLAASLAVQESDVFLYLTDLEVTLGTGDQAEWQALSVGTTGDPEQPWKALRATFTLEPEIAPGQWLVRLGPAGIEAQASLGGEPLSPLVDPLGNHEILACGPLFEVPSALLKEGTNRLEVSFSGEAGGLGLERGPAYLLSPVPADCLRQAILADLRDLPIANFGTAASRSEAGEIGQRITFKSTRLGGKAVNHASLTVHGVTREGREVAIGRMQKKTPSSFFPHVSTSFEDQRFPNLKGINVVSAPLSRETGLMNNAGCFIGQLRHSSLGASPFSFRFRLRVFPHVGGPLRLMELDDTKILHNDSLAFFATGAELLGTREQPTGFDVVLRQEGSKSTNKMSGSPKMRNYGMVLFEPERFEKTRVHSLEDLVSIAITNGVEFRNKASDFSSRLIRPLNQNLDDYASIRRACAASVCDASKRHRAALPLDARGILGARQYFRSSFGLVQLPENELKTLEWLLQTQRSDGAIAGDLVDDDSLSLVESTLFAVLRATQYFEWTYDGDTLLQHHEALGRGLAFVRSLDHDSNGIIDFANLTRNTTAERASSSVLALAELKATRDLATSLEFLGETDAAAALADTAQRLGAAVLRPVKGGGLLEEPGFAVLEGEDPREQVVAITWALLPEASDSALWESLSSEPLPPAAEWDEWDYLRLRTKLLKGEIKSAHSLWAQCNAAVLGRNNPFRAADAALYDTLFRGILAIRRPDLGMLEVVPRIPIKTKFSTLIELPEGAVSVQYSLPDYKFHRYVNLDNRTDLDLELNIGVPGGFGTGPRTKLGEFYYSYYEITVPSKTRLQEHVR